MGAGVALVAGATGAVASRLVTHLAASGWQVFGLSRTPGTGSRDVRYIGVDLLDGGAVRSAVRALPGVTQVFYTARAKHGEGGSENVADNVAMLQNVLDAANAHDTLRHIHLVEGGKWYGQHLGAYATPAREDDPRHLPPNFYYDQEDLLIRRRQGRGWTWSACRPNVVYDFAPERPRNLVSIVGAYAAICRELGLPLDYPGHPEQFRSLTEITDAGHLARAITFIATTPACADRAFNVTDGGLIRWERLWPRVAGFFDMPVGRVRTICLADMMADKEALWSAMVERHGLVPRRLVDLALWPFADTLFRQTYDVVSSTLRIRQAGFHEIIDSEACFLGHLAAYRAARLLP